MTEELLGGGQIITPKKTSSEHEVRRCVPIANVVSLVDDLAEQLPLLDAQREGIEMHAAPRFSPFELFQPGELVLSRIIAELLDPRGSHGQGTLFLNAFLRALNQPPVRRNGLVTVAREVPTSISRRIDLVIETSEMLLGVENKPSAAQQPNQLRHYADELSVMAGRKASCLVFLSDQEPKSAKEDVVCLPFVRDDDGPSLTSILRDATSGIRAPRVAAFLADFIEHLNEYHGDGANMTSSEEPYIETVQTEFQSEPARRKAIAAVFLAHEAIQTECIGQIEMFLEAHLRSYRSDFERSTSRSLFDELDDRDALWGLRRPHWPANCAVGVSSCGDLDDIYYGVWAPTVGERNCKDRPKLDVAVASVPNRRRTKWYPWWQHAQLRSLDLTTIAGMIIETPNGVITEHKDVRSLASGMLALAEAIDGVYPDPL